MSGLVKAIKKRFEKITKFVKKYWKVIVIAAAIYFTAGVALSYFGSTAGFASAMPGFGANGIFAKAAVAMGFQGSASVASGLSLTSGAFTAGVAEGGIGSMSSAALKGLYGKTAAEVTAASNIAAADALGTVGMTSSPMTAGHTVGQTMALGAPTEKLASQVAAEAVAGGGGAGGTLSATDALLKAATSASKMQMGATLLKTAAGFLSPSEEDLIEKKHELEWGQAFGVDRAGNATYGWGTGKSPSQAGSTGGGSQFADQYSSQQGGSMYAPNNNQNQNFLTAPFNYTGTRQLQQQPQDFLVQPQLAGAM